jgi:hypothetical protein
MKKATSEAPLDSTFFGFIPNKSTLTDPVITTYKKCTNNMNMKGQFAVLFNFRSHLKRIHDDKEIENFD